MPRTLIFTNPAAGGGLTPARRGLLERLSRALPAEVLGLETTSAAEFHDLIRRTVQPGDRVLFAGGDGTLHQGLNAAWRSGAVLGYLPFGTGNAAAYALGLSPKGALAALSAPDEAGLLKIFATGTTREIDLVRVQSPEAGVEGEVAVFASAGWCALMAQQRKGKGLTGYVGTALRNLAGDYYEQKVTVTVDGVRVWGEPSTFVVVAKSPYYGAGVAVVPKARLDDGKLHVAVYNLNRAEMAVLYPSILAGFARAPEREAAGREVRVISAEAPYPVQTDGDYRGDARRSTFTVMTRAVRVIVGPW